MDLAGLIGAPGNEDLAAFVARLQQGVRSDARLSEQDARDIIDGLPKIDEDKLVELGEKDSSCPICLNTYLAIIAEEEMALAMDSPAHPIEWLGVTKLSQSWQCGHMFCRRDITKWVQGRQGTCPMCRGSLVDPTSARPLQGASETPAAPEAAAPAAPGSAPAAEPPASTEQPAPAETYGPIPIPEFVQHIGNMNLTGMNPDLDDPNAPSFEELRRLFLGNNPWIPAGVFDGLTNGVLMRQGSRGGSAATEEQPEDDRNEYSSMYS